jgi:hypothetical protein
MSTGFIVLFSYMNTKYIHHIHPPLPFPYTVPYSNWNPPLDRTYFTFLSFILKQNAFVNI